MPKLKPFTFTVDFVNSLLSYDENTGEFKWKETGPGRKSEVAGTYHPCGYRTLRIGGRQCLAHRVAWYIMTGEQPEEIDHINGVRDDNRFSNLRAASRSENQFNVPSLKNNTSGVKGVSWNKEKKAWDVEVWAYKKKYRGGRFRDFSQAVNAVISLRERLHREFCNHGDIKK